MYAITRRGFGKSSKLEPIGENYDADRLADDVLTVMTALGIDRPILAGHSIAGNELSSIGSRYPERVAGLVYLDATDGVGYYNPNSPVTIRVDTAAVRRALAELHFASSSRYRELVKELQVLLPQLQTSLQWGSDKSVGAEWPTREKTPDALIVDAVWRGIKPYTDIKAPALVIVAYPWKAAPPLSLEGTKINDSARAKMIDALRSGWPRAKVVTIPNSTHHVYLSNEAEVIREMNVFMGGMK